MRRWVILSACSLAFGGGSAQAAGFSVYSYSLGQVVQTGGVFGIVETYSDELFVDTFPDANAPQFTSGNTGVGLGTCSSSARATFGSLTVGSDAADGENPDDFPDASATGRGRGEVMDTLHVLSASLPDGTPVTLDVELNLTGNYPTSSTDDPGKWYASAYATLDASNQHTGLHLEFNNGTSPATEILSGTIQPQVGDSVSLDYLVDSHSFVAALALTGGTQVGLTIQPRIHVDAANPDVTMTTDSGFDYGVPVPEPSRAAGEGVVAWMGCAVLAIRSRASNPRSADPNSAAPSS